MPNMPSVERWWWSAAGDRYFDLAAGVAAAPSTTSTLTLLGIDGARRVVDADAVSTHEVTAEQVLEGLLPELRAALERMHQSVAALDPALDMSLPSPDVLAVAERLVRGLDDKARDHLRVTVNRVAEDFAILTQIFAFGSLGEHLIAALGLSPTGGATGKSAFAWLGEKESASAMIDRVRAQVRAELNAREAQRPARSFDFKELIKPPRQQS